MSILEPTIRALLVLDADGARVSVKYYPPLNTQTLAQQQQFEKKILAKTNKSGRSEADILVLDNIAAVYKNVGDVTIYLVASSDENEVILYHLISTLDEVLQHLLKQQVSKRTLIENFDLLQLTIDEMIDSDGSIVESDSPLIIGRVCMQGNGVDSSATGPGSLCSGLGDVPISEQTFTQALQSAREQLVKSFR